MSASTLDLFSACLMRPGGAFDANCVIHVTGNTSCSAGFVISMSAKTAAAIAPKHVISRGCRESLAADHYM